MSDPTPVLTVILVNFNTREMTLDCLRSLVLATDDLPMQIILVDNASSDGSVEAVRASYPQVELISSDQNLGFGAGNNLGLKRAKGKYILLLNTDAFLKAGALEAMIGVLEREPRVGVVGPRTLCGDGSLQTSCYRFPTPARAWIENLWLASAFPKHPRLSDYRRWAHDQERDVDWVIGACLLLRRSVYESVGGFDERFFMYSEEADLQRRIRGAGWRIRFTPDACVTHLGGASGANDRPRINRHFFASLDKYVHKHHGLAGVVALRAAMVVGCSLRAVAWTATLLLRPGRRGQAAAKARMMSWLAFRQLTHWRLTAA